jgi:hypothetical protein
VTPRPRKLIGALDDGVTDGAIAHARQDHVVKARHFPDQEVSCRYVPYPTHQLNGIQMLLNWIEQVAGQLSDRAKPNSAN